VYNIFFHVIYIMDDIFCNTKYLFYKFVLFKYCCYCFVRWTICNLSVCRKINRQYKHNLSCILHYHRRPYRRIIAHRHFTVASLEMPQASPMTLCTDYSRQHFTIASLEMPQPSPMTWRTDYVRRHFKESGGNATITDEFVDGYSQSAFVGNSQLPIKSPTDGANSKGQGIKCIFDRV